MTSPCLFSMSYHGNRNFLQNNTIKKQRFIDFLKKLIDFFDYCLQRLEENYGLSHKVMCMYMNLSLSLTLSKRIEWIWKSNFRLAQPIGMLQNE